jgi:hypothetical protein
VTMSLDGHLGSATATSRQDHHSLFDRIIRRRRILRWGELGGIEIANPVALSRSDNLIAEASPAGEPLA